MKSDDGLTIDDTLNSPNQRFRVSLIKELAVISGGGTVKNTVEPNTDLVLGAMDNKFSIDQHKAGQNITA